MTSMVGDYYMDKYKEMDYIKRIDSTWNVPLWPPVDPKEFNKLKEDVAEMKLLLKRAKKYDEENDQPHCEMDEKVELLKKLAELVGIDLEDVFSAA